MHCLYCDRPLALLKRLTGDGEFCSKEHRKIYQQEHNQLGLARLLESQPKAKEKPRPEKAPAVKPQPEVVAPIKAPEAPQPELAGFIAESVDAGLSAARIRQFEGAPRFKQEHPVWGRLGRRPGPRPKTAGFLAASSAPGFVAGTARLRDKVEFRSPNENLQLEEKRVSAAVEAARRPQPAGAGFIFERSAARLSFGAARQSSGVRFSPLTPVTARIARDLSSLGDCKLRMAKFVSAVALERATAAAKIRLPVIETRWKPLSPALPAQSPARIILVLGSFLQRPVRPANQDLPPQTFEIPFQPISYPQFSPRMGCLEERLHRTDRIGFSPP
jgi:hypothetical protein